MRARFPNRFSSAYAARGSIGVWLRPEHFMHISSTSQEGTMRRASYALVAVLAIASFARHSPADGDNQAVDDRDHLQLVEATVPQLNQALRSHLVTSEQLVRMYQARIAAYDKTGPTLNAFLNVNRNAIADA